MNTIELRLNGKEERGQRAKMLNARAVRLGFFEGRYM